MREIPIITRESLINKNIDKRKARALAKLETAPKEHRPTIETALMDLETGKIPRQPMPEGFSFKDDTRTYNSNGQTVVEFIGGAAGSLGANYSRRQSYEVQAGRDMEPTVYDAIYDVTTDPDADEVEDVYTMSDDDVGMIFTEIKPGGEVKFATVTSGQHTMRQVQYAAGIEYTKRMFMFNKFDLMSRVERRAGMVANAMENNIHMTPILSPTGGYPTRCVTNGTTLTDVFGADDNLVEKYHLTFDQAITDSRDDDDYPRRGPYVLVCTLQNLSMIRKSLTYVEQRNFARLSPEVIDSISAIVVYDGFTGSRGSKETSYAGVSAGEAFLVSTAFREEDFQSKFKQQLMMQKGNPDVSRFVLEQEIYDFWVAVYSAPTQAVQKIILPESDSGD